MPLVTQNQQPICATTGIDIVRKKIYMAITDNLVKSWGVWTPRHPTISQHDCHLTASSSTMRYSESLTACAAADDDQPDHRRTNTLSNAILLRRVMDLNTAMICCYVYYVPTIGTRV